MTGKSLFILLSNVYALPLFNFLQTKADGSQSKPFFILTVKTFLKIIYKKYD
jgi:hypothetical protein